MSLTNSKSNPNPSRSLWILPWLLRTESNIFQSQPQFYSSCSYSSYRPSFTRPTPCLSLAQRLRIETCWAVAAMPIPFAGIRIGSRTATTCRRCLSARRTPSAAGAAASPSTTCASPIPRPPVCPSRSSLALNFIPFFFFFIFFFFCRPADLVFLVVFGHYTRSDLMQCSSVWVLFFVFCLVAEKICELGMDLDL